MYTVTIVTMDCHYHGYHYHGYCGYHYHVYRYHVYRENKDQSGWRLIHMVLWHMATATEFMVMYIQ